MKAQINTNKGENMTKKIVNKFVLGKESRFAPDGVTKLFRLIANVTFKNKFVGTIKKGTVGGWVESLKLKNDDARVSGDAWVSGNAWVYGDAWVSGNAWVYDDARVSGRFDLSVSCNFEIPRITIDTKEKLQKLKDFLEKF